MECWACAVVESTTPPLHHSITPPLHHPPHPTTNSVASDKLNETVVPFPGEDSTSQLPLRLRMRSRKLLNPFPECSAIALKPLPSSLIKISSLSSKIVSRNKTSRARPWRTALLRISLTASSKLCRASAGILRSGKEL